MPMAQRRIGRPLGFPLGGFVLYPIRVCGRWAVTGVPP